MAVTGALDIQLKNSEHPSENIPKFSEGNKKHSKYSFTQGKV